MPLPSAVTVASLAIVVAAGVGYAVSASASDANQAAPQVHRVVVHHPPATEHTVPSTPAPHVHHVVPSTLVVVFNNTGVPGLAAQKATVLRNAGWNVAATDNWYGSIPADTVYYPPSLEAQAKQLAATLHITRLHAAVAPMQFDRLTVIIATS
jgi:hypothetical protein